MRSSWPDSVAKSSQSLAWIREWRNETVTLSRGHCLRVAYMRKVIAVQAPSPASSRSYGVGPVSRPTGVGSSAFSRCRPAVMCCPYGPRPFSDTTTTPCSVPALAEESDESGAGAASSSRYLLAQDASIEAAKRVSATRVSKWSAPSRETNDLGWRAASKMLRALSMPTVSSEGECITSSAAPSRRIRSAWG